MIDPILPAVVDRLGSLGALEEATLERLTVGDAAVMVEVAGVGLSGETDPEATAADGRASGLAHRPAESGGSAGDLAEPTDDIDLDALVQWATRPVTGSSTGTIADPRGEGDGGRRSLETALGVAAVNALSAPFVDWRAGDPMALLDPAVETIATVGLFRPAFRKFSDVDVRVIERRDVGPVSAPDGITVATYRPDEANAAMADADVVFVTGSAFVYGGLEAYLEAAPETAAVVLIGATASVLPEPAFDAGVDVVAGAAVTDPARVREAVRTGACGTDLHDAGVRKVYAVADRAIGPDRSLTPIDTERGET